jgi:ribosomal protein S18 acetylase RimI-like enzyme
VVISVYKQQIFSMNEAITQSTSRDDISFVLEVLASYAPSEDELREQRRVLECELAELGDNRLLYIAWADERPVGVVQLLLNHADNDPQLADGVSVAHVHHLRVLHDMRRQGTGRRLMEFIDNEAQRMGYRQLTLGVDSWNTNALAFYGALGYEVMKEEAGQFPETTLYYLRRDLI